MSTRQQAQARSPSAYSVLLLQKLLSLRDSVSPLTLVQDSARASGVPLLEEIMLRQKSGAGGRGTRIVYAASYLAPPRRSPHVDTVVERRGQASLEAFRASILKEVATGGRTLIVVDSLCQIARQDPLFVAAFVSSLVSPTTSVVGLYHGDEDGPAAAAADAAAATNPLLRGKPRPLTVLTHLATAVLHVQPLHEEVVRKRARDRAEEPPQFGWWTPWLGSGLGSGGLGSTALDRHSLLVDMELRRRSGRAVVERYVVVLGSERKTAAGGKEQKGSEKQLPLPWEPGATPCTDITVMADHPLFAPATVAGAGTDSDADDADGLAATTFNLGLTEKQRRDRDGIVLPYFDAQTDIGEGAGGGRILYDMGREDDFDDEEDEI